MTIRGTATTGKQPVYEPKQAVNKFNFDNIKKTLEASANKLIALGIKQPPLRLRLNSLNLILLEFEKVSRLAATKSANFLATDFNVIKLNVVGILIYHLMEIIRLTTNSYDSLTAKATDKEQRLLDNYLFQFTSMVTELVAALGEKLKNANNKTWHLSQHEEDFNTAIMELNHLYILPLENSSIDSKSAAITNSENTFDTWKDWTYVADTSQSYDSAADASENYQTLVVKQDDSPLTDNFASQTMFIKKTEDTALINKDRLIVESIGANKEIKSNKLQDDYFVNLQQKWNQASKRSISHMRSQNTKNLDAALTDAISNTTDNDEIKLKKLLRATNIWLMNEANKKSIVPSSRLDKVLKLKCELENKLYLINIESNADYADKDLLKQTLVYIEKLIDLQKKKGGFKKIANIMKQLKDDENAEKNIELFREIQKIAAKRLTGKGLTTFFACLTRSQQRHAIYKALMQAELISSEDDTQPLLKLISKLEAYLPDNLMSVNLQNKL